MKELDISPCEIEEALRLAGTIEMLKKDDDPVRTRLIDVGESGHRFNGMAFFQTLLGLTAYIQYFILRSACHSPSEYCACSVVEIRAEHGSKVGEVYADGQHIGRVELLNAIFKQQLGEALSIARPDRPGKTRL